jgi:limonene-1,2-epoxide hydrolase
MATQQQSLREKREAIVLEHVNAENRHDVAASVATFHAPRYQVLPMGIIHDGKQAVEELLSGVFTGFPDFRVDIKATGRSMDVPVVCIFEFNEDKLLCEKVYFDMATLVNQLTANK